MSLTVGAENREPLKLLRWRDQPRRSGPAVLRADCPDHWTFDSLRDRLDAPDAQWHLS